MIRSLNADDLHVWHEAVVTLARIGEPGVLPLIEGLSHDSAAVRAGAAGALGYIAPPARQAVAPLIDTLGDADASVRYCAAEALARIASLQTLAELLRHDNPDLRMGGAYALGRRLGLQSDALEVLAEALEDENVAVRRVAAESLAPGAREQSAEQLGLHAVPALLSRLRDDPDPTVRFRAARALTGIDPQRGPEFQAQADVIAAEHPIVPYYGFEHDRKMVRYTEDVEGFAGSSGEAIAAGHRLFTDTPFKGMSRERVLEIMGDPATLSAYGRPAAHQPGSPMEYKFDSGWGGFLARLHFKADRVERVEILPLN